MGKIIEELKQIKQKIFKENDNNSLNRLKDIISFYPRYLPASILYIEYLIKNKDIEKAKEYLIRAKSLSPFHPVLISLEQEIRKMDKREERPENNNILDERKEPDSLIVPEAKEKQGKITPEKDKEQLSPFVNKEIAELYEKQGYTKEAIKIYKDLLKNKIPQETQNKINELMNNDQATDALKIYKELIKENK